MLLFFVNFFFFFFNDTATTEIYILSLHDALPISHAPSPRRSRRTPADKGNGWGQGRSPARRVRGCRRSQIVTRRAGRDSPRRVGPPLVTSGVSASRERRSQR